MNVKYLIALGLIVGTVTLSNGQGLTVPPSPPVTTTLEPSTTACEPSTTTCEPSTTRSTTPKPTTATRTTTPKPTTATRTTTPKPTTTTCTTTPKPTTTTRTTTPKPTTTTCTTTPKPTTATRTTTPKTTTATCTCTTTPKPTTKPTPSWKPGVDKHVQQCKIAPSLFVGQAHKTANNLLDAVLCLINNLESSTKSLSQILSSKATEILEKIGVLIASSNSPKGYIEGYEISLHDVFGGYRNTVVSVEVTLGISVSNVTDAMSDLEVVTYQSIDDYKKALYSGKDNVDYKAILKCIRNLANAVACLSEAALENCENDADVRDSLCIIVFIFYHLVMIGHAVIISIAAELSVRCGVISTPCSNGLDAVNKLIIGLTQALNALVGTEFKAVVTLVKAVCELAKSLDDLLKSVLGLVENVTENITKPVLNILGVTGGLLNILK